MPQASSNWYIDENDVRISSARAEQRAKLHRSKKPNKAIQRLTTGVVNKGFQSDGVDDVRLVRVVRNEQHAGSTDEDEITPSSPWRIDQESQPILDQKKSSRAYIDDAVSRHRSVALGMHLPTWYNEKSSKKSKHHRRHHKSDRRSQKQQKEPEEEVLPPQQQVQFLLGAEHAEDGKPTSQSCVQCDDNLPKLFTEMEELQLGENGEPFWKETARWIKFEECVDAGGDRWSKPHVATLSLHSLLELRSCLLNGVVQLDMEANSLEQIADMVLDILVSQEQLPYDDELRDKVKFVLLSGHEHQKDGKAGSMNPVKSVANMMSRKESNIGMKNTASGANLQRKSSGSNLQRKSSGSSMQRKTTSFNGGPSTIEKSPSNPTSPTSEFDKKKMPYFMKKIPTGAEASNVLVGEADFLDRPLIAFVRLRQGLLLEGITEVPIPTRFLFLLLGPLGNSKKYHEIGRSIATLMSDEVFHDVAYKARTRQDLLAGIDEFLDQVTVLPPGEWDPKIRIEPPQDLPKSQMPRLQPKKSEDISENGYLKLGSSHGVGPELQRTGRLFGGLMADIRRKIPFYASDFRDALSLQCVASMIFLYFAVLTPIVTFGGLLGDATQNSISAIESIFGGALAGSVYHLCSGQPLTIIGSTGPILVFETIMFDICSSAGIEYLPIRWWVGVWTGLFCIILVATDASSLVQYITRYTEESFSALISLIFIFEAFKKLAHVEDGYPIWHGWQPDDIAFYNCSCVSPNITGLNVTENLDFDEMRKKSKELALKSHGTHISGTPYRSGNDSYSCAFDGTTYNISDINAVNWTQLNKTECLSRHCGELEGESCHYTPDVMLMSVVLFFGTFAIAWALKAIKLSNFFPSKVRSVISDFAVTIGIFVMVVFDIVMKLDTPKLTVPDSFRPTRDDRGWVISPLGKNEWWTIPLSILPALLCTILIFMDQQITAVIVNRKENKLKKGAGYHLDLLIVAVMMIICSVLGLPWFVAATVLSITHVNSLKMESETSAPGEIPRFLGVREQRVTGIMIFLLIGVSIFITPILAYIPMPVLYGVFLYMGVSSLKGVQFIDRCLLFFMPSKHQPDYVYLRHVPLPKVYLFTFFQLVGLVMLWVIKSMKPVSIIFPMMVAALVGVRKLFDYAFFSQEDLFWLDDIMPESAKKKKEDKKKKQCEDAKLIPISGQGTVTVPLDDGMVLKIPASEIQYNPNEPTDINISKEMAQTALWKAIVQNEGSGADLKSRERLARTNSSGTASSRTNGTPEHRNRTRGPSSVNSDSTAVVIEG